MQKTQLVIFLYDLLVILQCGTVCKTFSVKGSGIYKTSRSLF